MVGMTTFDESKHPRGQAANPGQFASKTNDAPTGGLTASEPPAPRPRGGASLKRGDFGGYTLSKVSRMNGREGEAFSATIMLNGKAAGELIQDGNGGETWARWNTREHREAFEQLVKDHWDFEQDYTFAGHHMVTPYREDAVLDALYEEHDTRKRLNRARTGKKLSVLTRRQLDALDALDGHDGITEWGQISNGVGIEKDLLAHPGLGPGLEGASYWDGEAWVPFADLA